MFFLTLCLLFIIRLRFPTGKSIAEIILCWCCQVATNTPSGYPLPCLFLEGSEHTAIGWNICHENIEKTSGNVGARICS